MSETWALGGPVEYRKLVAQGNVLEEQNRAGEEERTEQGGSGSEQQHPVPPRGQGGHSVRDPMLRPFSAKLF